MYTDEMAFEQWSNVGVFNEMYSALNNIGAVAQADRKAYLVPFL